MKLHYKLFIFFVILLLIFGVATIISTSITLKGELEKRLIDREKIGLEILEKRIFPYLANKNYIKVTSILFEEKEIKIESIYYIVIYDRNGNVVAHTFLNEIPEQLRHNVHSNNESFSTNEYRFNNVPVINIDAAIKEDNFEVGHLSIGHKKEYIDNIVSQIIGSIVNILMILSIFPIFLSFFMSRLIVKPVNELARGMEEVSKGNLDHKVKISSNDEIGELAGIFNEMSTDLNKSLEKLHESEKRYRKLFESAGDAIFILDAQGENAGQIVDANKAAAEMHGYKKNEKLPLNMKDLDTPEAAKGLPYRISRMLKGEQIKEEILHMRKDGTVFPVEVNAGLLEIGDHKYILAFDRDITERKLAEEELTKYRDNLKELIKERTAELNMKNEELERFNKLFVGRELRMVELKKIIAEKDKIISELKILKPECEPSTDETQ